MSNKLPAIEAIKKWVDAKTNARSAGLGISEEQTKPSLLFFNPSGERVGLYVFPSTNGFYFITIKPPDNPTTLYCIDLFSKTIDSFDVEDDIDGAAAYH